LGATRDQILLPLIPSGRFDDEDDEEDEDERDASSCSDRSC
jgi:hypothetical protein